MFNFDDCLTVDTNSILMSLFGTHPSITNWNFLQRGETIYLDDDISTFFEIITILFFVFLILFALGCNKDVE